MLWRHLVTGHSYDVVPFGDAAADVDMPAVSDVVPFDDSALS